MHEYPDDERFQVVDGRIRFCGDPAERPATVAQAFLDSVARHAGRPAIKPVNGPAVSYRELGERVERAVAVLLRHGLQAGDALALYLPNCPEYAVFTYACALLGARLVPVNVRYRPDELAHVLKGSRARMIVTQNTFLTNPLLARLREAAGGALPAGGAPCPTLPELRCVLSLDGGGQAGAAAAGITGNSAAEAGNREAGIVDYPASATAAPPAPPLAELAARRRGSDALWLFWTSGTTGAPKGALLPQSAIDVIWRWTTLADYGPDDRVLVSRPFFYIAGHFWALLGPLLHGAAVLVSDEITPTQMQAVSARERATVLSGNPLTLKALIEDERFDRAAFSALRLGYFGGFAMPARDMQQIRDVLGYRSMIQTYGMTEFGGFLMSTLPGDSLEVACASCGYPFTDAELKLVDPASDAEVAPGETGMLLTRGQPLIEYVNLPQAAARSLFTDDGWYRTGDLMRRLPDGRYQFVGRAKDLIKVNGENVTAAEIEDSLMKHPAISLVSVVGARDARRGEVPVAFFETAGGEALDAAAIQAWCKPRMAPYKVPARFIQVARGTWPMTTSGKIAKHELARSHGIEQ